MDNNDKINYKELYMGLKSLNPKITKDEIANTFRAVNDYLLSHFFTSNNENQSIFNKVK